MKTLCKKWVILILVGLIAGSFLKVKVTSAEEYPVKPIEFVVPWPAGGRTDIVVRMSAPFLEKNIGARVVVINKVGGTGLIGYSYVKNAKPDGYIISHGGVAVVHLSHMQLAGFSVWDYDWYARTYWIPIVLAVNANSPFKTVKDLVEFAKANPKRLKHGGMAGSSAHISSELFAKKSAIKLSQVPYAGEGAAVVALAGGEIDLVLGAMVAFKGLMEGGKLRVLGVASEVRNPNYPQIPTFKEQGFDYIDYAWEGIHTAKGLPKKVSEKLHEACRKTFTDPDLKEKFIKIGLELAYQPGNELTEWLRGFDNERKDLIVELGLSPHK